MARTVIDIDDEALAAAAKELGTTTKVDTVNRALADVAARSKRIACIESLLAADDDLENVDVMRAAWR